MMIWRLSVLNSIVQSFTFPQVIPNLYDFDSLEETTTKNNVLKNTGSKTLFMDKNMGTWEQIFLLYSTQERKSKIVMLGELSL